MIAWLLSVREDIPCFRLNASVNINNLIVIKCIETKPKMMYELKKSKDQIYIEKDYILSSTYKRQMET